MPRLFISVWLFFCCVQLVWPSQCLARKGENSKGDLQLFVRKNQPQPQQVIRRSFLGQSDSPRVKTYNPFHLAAGGLLYFYQNTLSQQFSASCLYHPGCSDFSKQAIQEYGLLKGAFLSADRLTRCNRISAHDIHPLTINQQDHRAADPVENYK